MTLEQVVKKLSIDYKYNDSLIEEIIKDSDYEIYGARKIEKVIMDKIDRYIFNELDSKVKVN